MRVHCNAKNIENIENIESTEGAGSTERNKTVAQSQFFTDSVIFMAAILFFVYFVAVAVILLHWRDWEVIWVIALLLVHVIGLYYYYIVWRRPDSPIVAFPETNLLARPYTCLVWLLIAVYAGVKLRERYHVRIADFIGT